MSFAVILFLPGCLFESPEKTLVVNTIEGSSDFREEERTEKEPSVFEEKEDAKNEEVVTSENIIVQTPRPGTILASPISITGKARVFENTVHVDIKKENGEVMISEVATAKVKDVGEYGEFDIQIRFYFRNTQKGFIEVYSLSPKDGSRENLVSIPVNFETKE